MRNFLLSVAFVFAACTVQPAGARCEQDQDCNSTSGEFCRNETMPNSPCQGASSCICCPQGAAANSIPSCVASNVTPDAGATSDR